MTHPSPSMVRSTGRSLLLRLAQPALCAAVSWLALGGCASSDDIEPGDKARDLTSALSGLEAVSRAEEWVDAELRYCNGANGAPDAEDKCWPLEGPSHKCNRESNPEWDPYRSDCSGLVSWAWGLPAPGRSTQGFAPYDNTVSEMIDASTIMPGDALNLRQGDHHHIILFKEWITEGERATFIDEPGCGSTPHAREFTSNVKLDGTDLYVGGYWYHVIRYKGLTGGGSSPEAPHSSKTPGGNVFGVKMNGTPGTTEVHQLSQSSGWQSFDDELTTPIGQTSPSQFAYTLGDFDQDGARDLFAIIMNGTGTGTTEVHVLSAGSTFQKFSIEVPTPLGQVNPKQWQFATGDADGDGIADLYAIAANGTGTKTTEVHILSGGSSYQKWIYETGTVLEERDTSNTAYLVGDYNHDGTPDLFVIEMNATGSNTTEVHVLDGSTFFQSYLLHTATALAPTDAGTFRFALADSDGDDALDLMAITTYPGTGSGKTEVHVLSGASGFQEFSAHSATALDPGGPDQWWFGAN